jgi:hypothetical protein
MNEIVNELQSEKRMSTSLSKELRELKEYLATIPSRPEDLEMIEQLK